MCPGDSQPPHSYTQGMRNVSCRTPPPQHFGCVPADVLGPNSTTLSRLSGWTPDGRALQAVAAGLQAPGLWTAPFPCMAGPSWPLEEVLAQALPPEPSVWQDRSHFPGWGTSLPPPWPPSSYSVPPSPPPASPPPNGTNATGAGMSPVPYPGFTCAVVDAAGGPEARIATLDLTGLVERGRLAATSVRLPAALAQLTHLRGLRASGFPVQGASSASAPLLLAQAWCLCAVDMAASGQLLMLRRDASLPLPLLLLLRLRVALTGGVDVLANLTSLKVLHLGSASLTGTLPAALFNAATSLQAAYLDNNQLSGPMQMPGGWPPSLEVLWLSSNQLSGTVPPDMGSLRTLLGGNNRLSGTLSSSNGTLSSALKVLRLQGNALQGTLPSEVSSSCMPSVCCMHLALVDAACARLYRLWTCVCMTRTWLAAAPDWRTCCTAPLMPLAVGRCAAGHPGSVFQQLHRAGAASCVAPTAPIPAGAAAVQQPLPGAGASASSAHSWWAADPFMPCSSVDLHRHALSVACSLVLLSVNYLQGTLPQEPPPANLMRFECANCSLSGQLPPWGSNDSANCAFTSYPTTSPYAYTMAVFNVSRNQLSGGVPSTYGAWQQLRVLDVSRNNLTDLTAAPLCAWGQLQELRASHNNISAMFAGEGLCMWPAWLGPASCLLSKHACGPAITSHSYKRMF